MLVLKKLIIRSWSMWNKKKKEKEEEVLVVVNKNPFTHLANKYKEYETLLKKWVAKQSLPVEAAVTTVTGAVPGAAFGVCFKTLTDHVLPTFSVPSRPDSSLNSQPHVLLSTILYMNLKITC